MLDADHEGRRLVYLASPYTHTTAEVMERRAHQVALAGVRLLARRWPLYCPIAHGHALTRAAGPTEHMNLARDAPLWDDASDLFLDLSFALVVLTIGGWQLSRGIEREVSYAASVGLPVRFLKPRDVARVQQWDGRESLDTRPLTASEGD